ncbi:ATP synthase F0 sector subunit b [Euzebya pacifica]|uniref:ATP synthase subunit b n=1 Tax=Euzebya pacifica TaxID=1608957 RepID=A0A346Y1T6_9ACTN|nr:F0F1 ATP synthase subunit B [Euzebya pacifica]AXV08433.1 ATP synthase F0 sector subunit b [Euzebya pacifica]
MPTPMIVLATEAGVDTELQLLPEIPELIWGFIAFSLLFIVISGRVFPQMNKALDERRAAIQGRIEEAEAQLAEAEKTRREYQESLSEARNEANQIIEDAKAQGERLKADIVARAEEEAAAIRARAASDSEAEKARALEELRGQVATLSTDIASKIVGAEVDQSRHDQLVDSFISKLSTTN